MTNRRPRALQRTAAPLDGRTVRVVFQRLMQPTGRFRRRSLRSLDPHTMNSVSTQTSVRRWRLGLLPFKAIIPATFVVLLFSDSAEHGSHIFAGIVYLCLGCAAVLLVGGAAAVLHTRDRRLLWSSFGFALGDLLLAAMLWGAAFPTPTKGL